ncbi:MAG: hypothetical protein H6R10_3062 [Rhodocyclaceae bacterium]|nr:hypothetical protein [Rhodocyclaceae bacterium]
MEPLPSRWPRRLPTLEELEPRILFSADLAAGMPVPGPWDGQAEVRLLESPANAAQDGLIQEQFTNYTGDQQIKANLERGQTFQHPGGSGAYAVNEISLALRRAPDAPEQNITVTLRDSWDGKILGSATIASGSLGIDLAFTDFSMPDMALDYGTTYTIRISTDGTAGKVYVGYDPSGDYPRGAHLNANGAPQARQDLAFKVGYVDRPVSQPISQTDGQGTTGTPDSTLTAAVAGAGDTASAPSAPSSMANQDSAQGTGAAPSTGSQGTATAPSASPATSVPTVPSSTANQDSAQGTGAPASTGQGTATTPSASPTTSVPSAPSSTANQDSAQGTGAPASTGQGTATTPSASPATSVPTVPSSTANQDSAQGTGAPASTGSQGTATAPSPSPATVATSSPAGDQGAATTASAATTATGSQGTTESPSRSPTNLSRPVDVPSGLPLAVGIAGPDQAPGATPAQAHAEGLSTGPTPQTAAAPRTGTPVPAAANIGTPASPPQASPWVDMQTAASPRVQWAAAAIQPPHSVTTRAVLADAGSRTMALDLAQGVTDGPHLFRPASFNLAEGASGRPDRQLEARDTPAPPDPDGQAVGQELSAKAGQVLGITMTAGAVLWSMRVSGLLMGMLATVPAWRQLDLLPILPDDEEGERPWRQEGDEEALRDEHSVGDILAPHDAGVRR